MSLSLNPVPTNGPVGNGPLSNGLSGEAIATGQQLLDVAQRLLRRAQDGRPPDWRALILHFGQLRPPELQPHYRIVARALVEDAAQRHGGQVFGMANGDLVLLCPASGLLLTAPRFAAPAQDLTLPETLARLLAPDSRDSVLSLWTLPDQAQNLLDYAATRLAEHTTAPAPPETPTDLAALDSYAAMVEASRITDLVHRQTGVAMLKQGMRPLYRELIFANGGLTDPFLARHLARRFDRRLLQALLAEHAAGGPLDATAILRLHINLSLPALLSDAAAALFQQHQGAPLGVEVPLLEAAADPVAFARARARLTDAGITLVLDAVSYRALLLTNPAALQPDLLKLDWSPLLPNLPETDRQTLEETLARLGPDRLILAGADTEIALRWSRAQGIARFQGRHVDAMLAASRVSLCPEAPRLACTLRQCAEREAATGPAGRRPCANHPLLDAAMPRLPEPARS